MNKSFTVLDSRAISYIKNSLQSGKTLSKLLLDSISFDKGEVFTTINSNLPEDKLYDFNSGGIDKKEKADRVLAEMIVKKLQEDSSNICIFGNANAAISDPFIKNLQSNLFFHQSEVYHFCQIQGLSINSVLKVISESSSGWLDIGFIARLDKMDSLMQLEKEFSLDDLKIISKNVHTIIISSYDGEGWVFWCGRILL